jgi:hypothetical protein
MDRYRRKFANIDIATVGYIVDFLATIAFDDKKSWNLFQGLWTGNAKQLNRKLPKGMKEKTDPKKPDHLLFDDF